MQVLYQKELWVTLTFRNIRLMKKTLLVTAGALFFCWGLLYMISPAAANENSVPAQDTLFDQELLPGKKIFVANCAPCHTLTKDVVGPALNGILVRWNGDTSRLKVYIQNPSDYELTHEDPYVSALKKDFYNIEMPAFPLLSDSDLQTLIIYING